MDSNGNFVVVWQDDNDNNDYWDIMARGFYANGNSTLCRFNCKYEGSGQQYHPEIAMDSNGNFVVVWEDDDDNNDIMILWREDLMQAEINTLQI